MKFKLFLNIGLNISISFFSLIGYSQYSIIPEPFKIEYKNSSSKIGTEVCIVSNTNDAENVKLFSKQLNNLGFIINNSKNGCKGKNIFIVNVENENKEIKNETYKIEIKNNKANLKASSSSGSFLGMQTLAQMLKPNIEISDCMIEDGPRFGWRGLMFDVSRNFFSIDDVKTYIDQMSKYKFNVFHWHLTDDEGWRIEIKSLPELTKIGAWRSEGIGKFGTRPAPKNEDAKTYGGFYTQNQIRDVVAYAKQRYITIVPEIDVPGHSMAVLAAYPELSTKKEEKFVSNGFKFSDWYADGTFKMLVENTLNPADEKVYTTLEKVFSEVADLFPGEYIHVGGDECYHGYWDENPECQKFMKEKGFKNSLDLQSYFMKRVEKIITKNGKKMIGWDEILYGGLAEGAAVMSWRGMKGGIEAAQQGHNVVMSPTDFAYLDYTQSDHSLELPIYKDLSLKKTYQFEPCPEGVDPKYILGGQGNLWTEQIPNLSHAFYMTYPRALALAEVLWSPKSKRDWTSFASRVEYHFEVYDKHEISICKALYDPFIKVRMDNGKLLCQLYCEAPNTDIYYTIDHTFPNKKSQKYVNEFELPVGIFNIRVNSFRKGKSMGRLLNISRDELVKRANK